LNYTRVPGPIIAARSGPGTILSRAA